MKTKPQTLDTPPPRTASKQRFLLWLVIIMGVLLVVGFVVVVVTIISRLSTTPSHSSATTPVYQEGQYKKTMPSVMFSSAYELVHVDPHEDKLIIHARSRDAKSLWQEKIFIYDIRNSKPPRQITFLRPNATAN